jgi:hypothetical protein
MDQDEIARKIKLYLDGKLLKVTSFKRHYANRTYLDPEVLAEPLDLHGTLCEIEAQTLRSAFQATRARMGAGAFKTLTDQIGWNVCAPSDRFMGFEIEVDEAMPSNAVRFVNCYGQTLREFHIDPRTQ